MDDEKFKLAMERWKYEVFSKVFECGENGGLRLDIAKVSYGEYDSMPKPTTAKQSDIVLEFMKMHLDLTIEDFEEGEEKRYKCVDVAHMFKTMGYGLRGFCSDESIVSIVLEGIIKMRKFTENTLNGIMFDDKKYHLVNYTGESDNEKAQLEIIEIIHVFNLFSKNAFDKIHNAWKVKRAK